MRLGRRPIHSLLALALMTSPWGTLNVAADDVPVTGVAVSDSPTFESRALSGSRMDVAALLLAGGESGALWAAAQAVPRPSPGDTSRVDFWMEIDGASLLDAVPITEPTESQPLQRLRLELHVYAMTPERQLAGSWSHRARLPVDELRKPLAAGGVRFAGHLELPAGEIELRLLALAPTSQRFALRILSLTVPKRRAPAPTAPTPTPLASPLFADSDTWIQVQEPETASPSGIPAIDYPAALPVLRAGAKHSLWFENSSSHTLPQTAHLTPIANLDATSGEATAIELSISPVDDTRHHRADFDVPHLASGTYRFAVSTPEASHANQRVFVVGDDVQDPPDLQTLTWTALRHLTAETSPAQSLELEDGRRAAQQITKISAAYRSVLTRLPTVGEAQSVTALCDMESQTLAASDSRLRGRTWLAAAQKRVIERLANAEPESLIPLLALHVKAHDRHVEQRDADPFLPGASRDRILTLAEIYTHQATSTVGRSLAAAALAEMGVAIDRAGLPMASRRMLEESLALDPSQASTLLYLAYWHQRRAAFDDAVPLLRQLLAVAPQSQQGKLRLAHGLAHQGKNDEAARLLRQVLQAGSADWLLTLAYQELGRLLLVQQRGDEAARLLAAAVARLPSQQGLRVQLAYALDRSGESRQGRELLADLPADRGRPSPRNLYSQRPQAADSNGRNALQRHAMARLPLLVKALEQTASSR